MPKHILIVVLLIISFVTTNIYAATEEELAKAAQNPLSDLISLPFQNNTNFEVGPNKKTQNVLNIQPVVSFALTSRWNLVTRTIVPLISQPAMLPGDNRKFGLGDVVFSAFLSPANPGKLIWGVGPVMQLPSATDKVLGTEKWGLGPSFIALQMQGPWVYGALFNNIWSVAGKQSRDNINIMTIQPFINYNFSGGRYISSSPIITANWCESSNNRWFVPLGAGVGKILKLDKVPINCAVQGFYSVVRPQFAAKWTIRLQVQFLFPKA